MQISGKNIVLTGAQGGIGQRLHQSLLDAGAHVYAIGRKAANGIIPTDLANKEKVATLCETLRHKDIDILINLAGMMYFGHFDQQSSKDIEKMIAVNITSPIQLAQALIPNMLERGQGKIVNIGSIFGALAFPHFVTYSATKAGLKSFSEGLRREYDGKGIHVTHIAPRAVNTPFNTPIITELHKRTQTHNDSIETVTRIILQAIIRDENNVSIGIPETIFSHINAILPSFINQGLRAKRDIANTLLNEYTS